MTHFQPTLLIFYTPRGVWWFKAINTATKIRLRLQRLWYLKRSHWQLRGLMMMISRPADSDVALILSLSASECVLVDWSAATSHAVFTSHTRSVDRLPAQYMITVVVFDWLSSV